MAKGTDYKVLSELESLAGLNRQLITIIVAFVGCSGHRITLGNNQPIIEEFSAESREIVPTRPEERVPEYVNRCKTADIENIQPYEGAINVRSSFRPFD